MQIHTSKKATAQLDIHSQTMARYTDQVMHT